MAKPLEVDQQWLKRIADQVGGLQYGSVNITVHDGRIVQIDRTERTRYDQPSSKQQEAQGVKQQAGNSHSNSNSNSNSNKHQTA
ncbi:YezD family protein [Paenibacillus sp. KS-LC4]|uniref:YezD family protein n=1 Tax=Paenibacillus sp. KS-LC4 TaxID=2979727 RepID=UPI0030CCC1D0